MHVLKDVPASVHHSPEEIGVGTRAREHVPDQLHYLQPQRLQCAKIIDKQREAKNQQEEWAGHWTDGQLL